MAATGLVFMAGATFDGDETAVAAGMLALPYSGLFMLAAIAGL